MVFYRWEPSNKYCYDADQIALNMHTFFFTYSHWFALQLKNQLKRGNLYLGKGLHLGFNYTMYGYILIWYLRSI